MTTASTAQNVSFRKNRLLQIFCVLSMAAFIASGIRPVVVGDWWLEQGMVFVAVGLLIATYRWLPLSQLSYLLIFIFFCMHEWGAHYRYALDPLGEWMKQFQATSRNQFDRWTHFAFGFLLFYPQREILLRRANLRGHWAFWIPVTLLLGYGAAYELIEGVAAAVLSVETSEAFLALQGDPWDTHKDMFMCLAGGTIAMVVTVAVTHLRAARLKALDPLETAARKRA